MQRVPKAKRGPVKLEANHPVNMIVLMARRKSNWSTIALGLAVLVVSLGVFLAGVIYGRSHRVMFASRYQDWSIGVLRHLSEHLRDKSNITFVNHEYAWAMEGSDHSAYDEWQRYVGTNPTHRYEQPWGKLPCAPYELLFRAYDENGFPGAGLSVTEFRYGWMTNLYNKSLASGVANVNLKKTR